MLILVQQTKYRHFDILKYALTLRAFLLSLFMTENCFSLALTVSPGEH